MSFLKKKVVKKGKERFSGILNPHSAFSDTSSSFWRSSYSQGLRPSENSRNALPHKSGAALNRTPQSPSPESGDRSDSESVAELDRLGEGHQVQQSTQTIRELEDTSKATNATHEGKSELEKSHDIAALIPLWQLWPSIDSSKPADDHAQDSKGASPKVPPVPPKIPEMEGTIPSYSDKIDPIPEGSQGSQRSFPTSRNWQNAPIPVQSGSNAEEHLDWVVQRVFRAADGYVRRTDLDAVYRKKGVDGALELLIGSYESGLAVVSGLERQIRTAAEGNVREKEVNAAFRRRGVGGGLGLLIEQYQQAIVASRGLNYVEEKIREATHDLPRRDLANAFEKEGISGPLRLLIEDYRSKISSAHMLRRVGDQIREVLRKVPRKDLDAAFNTGGVEGAFNLLVKSYQPCVDAQQELLRVEKELKKAARGMLVSSTLDATIDRSGADAAIKLLVKELLDTTDSLKDQMEGLKKDISTARSNYSTLEYEKKKIDMANHELRMKQGQHETAINDLKATNREKLEDLDVKWRVELKNRQDDAATQIQNLEERHREELERRDASRRSELDRWEKTSVAAKENHKKEIAELQGSMDSLEIELNSKMDRIREEFAAREEEARRGEMARMEQLRLDHEALKGVLVAREHIKGLSDPEIYSSFKKLAGEVDSFSRIQWEKQKESCWPFPESTLKRSENPRKLKQRLVQSSIWVILNERIFRSPFEVFGEEGQKMHREWTDTFGEDRRSEFPHWPAATEDSEKWRYELVKECSDVLKKPLDDHIKNNRKQNYGQYLNITADEIYKSIETIAIVTENDLPLVQDFVKLAAKFWLDVSSQRCRILLCFPPLGTNVLGSRKALSKSIDLVVQPEVRRKGNVEGQRLDREQVVKGCEGEHTKFQAR